MRTGKWTISGHGKGRLLRLNGKPVATFSQVGWRWSLRWDVRAADGTGLALGSFLFSAKTISEAVALVTSRAVPTHESDHAFSDAQPLPQEQQDRIRCFYSSIATL